MEGLGGFGAGHILGFSIHELASDQRGSVSDLDQMSSVVIRGYVHTFAHILKYIVPLGFAIGAAVSYVKRARSRALFVGVRGDSKIQISDLTWQDFERLVGEGFRHRGFHVTERGGAGADGGVDLALVRDHERFLVQCKQWRTQSVGVSVVRELYGVMAAERAAGGYVVTAGTFTWDAKAFAAGRNIELIDGPRMNDLLRDGRDAPQTSFVQTSDALLIASAPVCPSCKSTMVLRTAKRGSRAGSSFWGCAQFPKCRQTVTIAQ